MMGAVPRGDALAAAIAARAPVDRDRWVDDLLGLEAQPAEDEPSVAADPELIRCVASGVSAVADAVLKAGIGPGDVVVDVGAGVGRVAMLVHLLTGARAVGLEIQAGLVAYGRSRVEALGLDGVDLRVGDARSELPDGTVFYLYLPFVGRSLASVVDALGAMAHRHAIAVCALGVELRRQEWLRPVDETSLWMTVHESVVAGVPPRRREPAALPSLRCVAEERPLR
jgi:SAM-dependent methyltransferase